MKIVVDSNYYNLQEDKRLLIPYMEKESRYGVDLVKFGLLDKQSNIVQKAKYDFIIGDSIEPDDIIVFGVIDNINHNLPYSVNAYVKCSYIAYNIRNGVLLEGFNSFTLSTDKKIITVHSKNSWGAIESSGKWIIPYGKYTWIDGFDKGFVRARIGNITSGQKENDAKWSLITDGGFTVYNDCNDIKPFYGKEQDYVDIVREKGKQVERKYFNHITKFLIGLSKPKPEYDPYDNREWLHRYDGSTEDAYEGEPDTRWNTD